MAKFKFKIAEKEYETNDEAEYRRWTEAEKAWLSGAVLREAASVSSGAALTRSRTPLYNAEGERVGTFAQDASPSIAQLTEPEIPVASLKSDLKRKRSLHSVMPKPEAEGLLDELLGDCADEDKDSEGRCPDDPDYSGPVDADETERWSGGRRHGGSRSLAEPEPRGQIRNRSRIRNEERKRTEAARALIESGPRYGGMAGDGQGTGGDEIPADLRDLSGPKLAAALAAEGLKADKSDPKVNFRSAESLPPVVGAACESCKYFNADSGSCQVVAGLVAERTVSDLWTAKKGQESLQQAVEAFRKKYKKNTKS